tara:strand:- start:1144 stop:2454 length:1311 start_codon:yes stop_codon:yes gene_type:complete
MATWKEVALVEDLTAAAVQTGEAAAGQVAIGSSTAGEITWTDVPSLSLIVGNGSNGAAVVVHDTAGDIQVTSSDSTKVKLDIVAGTVDTAKLATSSSTSTGVTPAKMSFGTSGGILAYHHDTIGSTVTGTVYGPEVLPAGTNGQILSTVVAGGKTYLDWIAGGTASTVTVTNGESQGSALPVIFGEGTGADKDLYSDASTTPFTYEADVNTLRVANIITSGSVTATGGFAGLASSATTVNTATTTNASCYVALFDSQNGQQNGRTDAGIRYDATNNMLTVDNLTVSGTNTILNTTSLVVEDKLIAVASNSATASAASGSGVVVNINNLAIDEVAGDHDDYCPRLVWSNNSTHPQANSANAQVSTSSTTMGWAIASHGADADASQGVPVSASPLYNIAPTLIEQATLPATASADIGIGAMYLMNAANGSRLFIQTTT